MEGDEECLDSPVLTINCEASQDNGFAWSPTWRSGGHKPDEMVGLKLGVNTQQLTSQPFRWACQARSPHPATVWPSLLD